VENDAPICRLIAYRLHFDGHDVYQAVSGEEALRVIELVAAHRLPARPFDLLILDTALPDLSGLELLEKLRAARYPAPAILLTAFPEGVIDDARRLGVPLLRKPFALAQLSGTARTQIAAGRRGQRAPRFLEVL
jgi:two-component system OmpR family response regulator